MVAQRRPRILDYTQKAFGFFSPTWSFKEEDDFLVDLPKRDQTEERLHAYIIIHLPLYSVWF